MIELSDLTCLSHDEKDALIRALWTQVQMLTAQVETLAARVAQLEAKLGGPPKTPDNSSVPPSQGKKPNHADKPKPEGPRKGSLGRKGGGRMLVEHPDETMIARPMCCARCRAALHHDDQTLSARYDKFDLRKVKPVVTRVEQYAGRCRKCGSSTLAPLPDGLEPGSPFSRNIVALAIYLRFTHAISYRRLSRLMAELFSLAISEGALDAAFRRAMPCFDAEVSAILARLRRSRVVCFDGTSVRVAGKTCWDWAEPAKVPTMRSIGDWGGRPRRHLRAKVDVSIDHLREAPVGQASTIGLDIAKHVFQAHGADAAGNVVFRSA